MATPKWKIDAGQKIINKLNKKIVNEKPINTIEYKENDKGHEYHFKNNGKLLAIAMWVFEKKKWMYMSRVNNVQGYILKVRDDFRFTPKSHIEMLMKYLDDITWIPHNSKKDPVQYVKWEKATMKNEYYGMTYYHLGYIDPLFEYFTLDNIWLTEHILKNYNDITKYYQISDIAELLEQTKNVPIKDMLTFLNQWKPNLREYKDYLNAKPFFKKWDNTYYTKHTWKRLLGKYHKHLEQERIKDEKREKDKKYQYNKLHKAILRKIKNKQQVKIEKEILKSDDEFIQKGKELAICWDGKSNLYTKNNCFIYKIDNLPIACQYHKNKLVQIKGYANLTINKNIINLLKENFERKCK